MENPVQSEGLEAARERFTTWRSNRKGRSAIPENLWNMAVKLCAHYTISQISTALRLDYTKLKIKVLQSRVISNRNDEGKNPFVEIQVPSHGSKEQNKHTIEFFRTDGSRMRILTGDCVLLNNLSLLFLQSK